MHALHACNVSTGVGRAWFSTYALVVDDLDDSREAARELVAVLDEDDTADLDQAPLGSLDGSVTHFCCRSGRVNEC